MARPLRIEIENGLYHIKTMQANLKEIMHFINATFAGYYNYMYDRVGPLFQGRYKSILIETDAYLLEVSRYIHLQAVKSGLVKNPIDYKWTSYNNYIDGVGFVETSWLTDYFAEDLAKARREYQKFVQEKITDYQFDPFKEAYKNTIWGDSRYIVEIKRKIVDKNQLSREIIHKNSLLELYSKERIMVEIKKFFNITDDDLRTKGKRLKEYQYVGIYLLKKYTGLSLNEIGDLFGKRHYSFISRVYHDAERRDKMKQSIKLLEEKLGLSKKSRPDST
jgi:putative transposase